MFIPKSSAKKTVGILLFYLGLFTFSCFKNIYEIQNSEAMFRQFFNPQPKVDVWVDSKVNVPRQTYTTSLCSASLRGLTDGLIMGFVIGGILGIMQGWVTDAKAKDLCLISSSWALNGAAIGAVTLALGNAIVYTDMTPGLYTLR